MNSFKVQRRFFAGDKWLYYKIYAGTVMQNRLLQNELFDLVQQLYADRYIDAFFFVRYTDYEGAHLRIRFQVTDPTANAAIISRFHEKLKNYVESRTISKVVLDTYNRELERYGTGNIEDVERLFSDNSLDVLHLLRKHGSSEDLIWLEAMRLMNDLYDQLEYGWEDKYRVSKLFYELAQKKIAPGPASKEELKKRYRDNSDRIHQWISVAEEDKTRSAPGDPHDQKHQEQKQRLQRIAGSYPENSVDRDLVICSILHMMFNRLFMANQNTIEMICYAMMEKYCKTRSVISKKTLPSIPKTQELHP